ncbi:ATP-dependent DNA helicase [Trichonephila clavipes]|nr:ATP-dependent DNA helicase [Trichonephila clavipes]
MILYIPRNSSTSSYFGLGIRKTHFATNTFMQIRRLRHVHGQFGILGQIINVPVSINTMVNRLSRNVDDDYCVNVHIKRRKIHRTKYLMGLVTKRAIKAWLEYLVVTPLYRMHDVTIDDSFFNLNQSTPQVL